MIEDVGTLVLRTIGFICKVTDPDATVIVPLTRALVSLLVTARPLSDLMIEHIGTAVLIIIGDRRLAAEPLSPAV
jgi:hypothetical protein